MECPETNLFPERGDGPYVTKDFQNLIIELIISYLDEKPESFNNFAYCFFLKKFIEDDFASEIAPEFHLLDISEAGTPVDGDRTIEGPLFNSVDGKLVFRKLSFLDMKSVLQNTVIVDVVRNEMLVKQGEKVSHFYIVLKGLFLIWEENGEDKKLLKILKNEGCFGDREIIADVRSDVNITAETEGKVLAMCNKSLRRLARKKSHKVLKKYEKLLKKVPVLSSMPESKISLLARALTGMTFKPREFILREGEPCHGLLMVHRGRAMLDSYGGPGGRRQSRFAYPGDVITLGQLFEPGPASLTARAVDLAGVAYLSSKALERIVGTHCFLSLRNVFDFNLHHQLKPEPSSSSYKQ